MTEPVPAGGAMDLHSQLAGLAAAHHETRRMAEDAVALASENRALRDVIATSAWIRNANVVSSVQVSVVMPTRNRAHRVRDAVGSVLAQTYEQFELIVVDDASDDETSEVLAGIRDRRVRVVRNAERLGEGGSRNVALDLIVGDVVAYLDDDNRWDPDWLRAVAWLFTTRPDVRVAYGARVVDDFERHHHRASGGGSPWMQLLDWDRRTHKQRCLIDMNVLAHRPSPARFDPGLALLTDWDIQLAMLEHADPFRLPVIAAYYTTDLDDRASTVQRRDEGLFYEQVVSRWHDWPVEHQGY